MNNQSRQRRAVVRGPNKNGGNKGSSSGGCSLSLIIIYAMVCMVFLYVNVMIYLSHYSSSISSSSSPTDGTTGLSAGKTAQGGGGGGTDTTKGRTADGQQRPSFRNYYNRSQWGDVQQQKQVPPQEPPRNPEQLTIEEHIRRRPNKLHDWGHGVNPQIIVKKDGSISRPQQSRPEDSKSSNTNNKLPPRILTAYLESVDQSTWNTKPLPTRTTTSEDLTKIEYPRLNSCTRLPEQFPIDDYPGDPACSGLDNEGDPFLPWIHDVFPTHDGKYIQFVAENKRRCKTGTTPDEQLIAKFMQPQIALFQHVAIKRLNNNNNNNEHHEHEEQEQRYRLSSMDDADEDGMTTRFICQFEPSGQETLSIFNVHYDYASLRKRNKRMFTLDGHKDGKFMHTAQLLFMCPVPENLIEVVRLGTSVVDDYATLFVNIIPIRTPPRYHRPDVFLAPKYKEFLYTKPEPGDQFGIFNTTVEWGNNHILPKIKDSGRWENIPICKPSLMTYGPPGKPLLDANSESHGIMSDHSHVPKQHKLVSCLWSSTGYTTRGNRFAVNDGQRRLLEWITYNKQIGFDHFYLYDNSGAFVDDPSNMDDTFSLKSIADLFPNDVTYINWPAKVCNNNPNNVDSVGDRSSQYAAEASCRLRFGPHVEWIGQFDVDEYFVPMGKYTSALQLLDQLDRENMKIINFASWRAWPRRKFIEYVVRHSLVSRFWFELDSSSKLSRSFVVVLFYLVSFSHRYSVALLSNCVSREPEILHGREHCGRDKDCFHLKIPMNYTMLQAYNCDRQKPGEKKEQMPAEKQFYRPSYVKLHFIHYSTVTALSEMNREEHDEYWKDKGKREFSLTHGVFPDPLSRFGDEVNEGTLVYSSCVFTEK